MGSVRRHEPDGRRSGADNSDNAADSAWRLPALSLPVTVRFQFRGAAPRPSPGPHTGGLANNRQRSVPAAR